MLIGMFTLYCLLKETASKQRVNYYSLLLFPHLPCPYMKKKNHYSHINKYLTHDNLHLLACFVFVCMWVMIFVFIYGHGKCGKAKENSN